MGRGKYVCIDVQAAARIYAKEGSLERAAKVLGVDDSTLRNRFIRHGIRIAPHAGKKTFKLSQDYFEVIDSEQKAYWLGFLFADGSIYRGRQGYKLTVRLARKDRCLIEALFVALGADNPIKDKITKKTGPAYKKREYPVSVGVISSKKLVCDLIAHGCVPKKSLVLRFPSIQERLLRHFIRGYFDGDGCISLTGNPPWQWSLLGTKMFLKSVQRVLVASCKVNVTKISRRKKIHSLFYGGRLNVLKISNFLYEGATVWLDRKRIKMEMSRNV